MEREIEGESEVEVLKRMGLSDSEIKLYLKLLWEKEATASALALKTGIHRRLAYDSLNKLAQRGLVSFVDKDRKRFYKAVNPNRLLDVIEERKEKLKHLKEMVERVLPDLIGRYTGTKEERQVNVYVGKEGIKRLFNDEIEEGKTIHLIGTPMVSEKILKYFLPSFSRRRYEKKIMIKGLFDYDMKGTLSYKLMEARFLPKDYISKVSIAIFGNKVGIIFWIKDPLVIKIEDKDAAASFLHYFNMLWDTCKKEKCAEDKKSAGKNKRSKK